MAQESLCKYAKQCSFYLKSSNDDDLNYIVTRNVFCRSGNEVWSECKRYKLYERNMKPPDEILPKDEKSINEIIEEIIAK